MAKLERIAMNHRGAYQSDAQYTMLDAVYYMGSTYVYVAKTPGTGVLPTDTGRWELMAAKGGGVTQAELDAVTSQLDAKALQLHLTEKTGYGVVSGLGVTAQSTPDMSVSVAAGTCYKADGTRFNFTSAETLAATAADATNPRIDIVYVSTAGVRTYLAGTAAATPAAPATPTGGTLLAEISVAAAATTIVAANIVAKKKGLWTEDWITPTLLNGWTSVVGETVQYRKHANGLVELRGSLRKSELSGIAFYLLLGYRPPQTLYAGATSRNTPARLFIAWGDGAVTPDKGTPADRITLTGVFFSTN